MKCKRSKTGFYFALDFWNFAGYTSSNLRPVSDCSILWKGQGILMAIWHRVEAQKIIMLQACCLYHPIDGPGVDLPIPVTNCWTWINSAIAICWYDHRRWRL